MDPAVPRSLRIWFVIHFVADLTFAVPLFLAPVATLRLLGWVDVDPVATRLVAAALFAIGIQSLRGRNDDLSAFRSMIGLKTIWSGTATLGLLWGQLEGGPKVGWAILAIFAGFHMVWMRYRFILGGSG